MGLEHIGLMFVIVPAVIGIIALLMMLSAVRDLLRNARLTTRGQQARGMVISSQVHVSGDRDNRSSTMVETIEFTTDRGQQIRTNPVRGDVGMLDRTGQEVVVFYDRERPERMIAPKNGRSLSAWQPVTRIGFSLVMLVFLSGFVVFTRGIFHGFPF